MADPSIADDAAERKREKQRLYQSQYAVANREKLRAYHRAWQKANRERLAVKDREDYLANREAILARNRAYQARNREKISAQKKIRRETHKDLLRVQTRIQRQKNATKILANVRDWQKKNPDKVKAYKANNKGRRRGATGAIDPIAVLEIRKLQRDKCAYCRTSLRGKGHVDHIVAVTSGGTNDRSNLQLTCQTCNLKKWRKDAIEFARECGLLL